MACFALLCQTLRSTFGLPHFVFPGLRLVCSLSSFRSFWLEFGSPTDSLALLVSGRVSFPHRVGGAGGRDKVVRMWKHGLTQPSSCCFLHLPAKKCFAMRTCQQGKRFAVSPPPVSPCSGRRAWKMPAIWRLPRKSPIDRMVHGNIAHRHPLPHVPPMSWPLCKWVDQGGGRQGVGEKVEALPSILLIISSSSSAASFISPAAAFPSPAFEPRCYILLSGTPAPSGTPCILRICPLRSSLPAPSGYSQPVYVHPSILPSDRIRCRRDTDTRTCTAGNVRVTPSPVALFLEVAECGRS